MRLAGSGAMGAQGRGEPAAGHRNHQGEPTASRSSRLASYRRRAWAGGAIAFVVVAAVCVLMAGIAADRRAALLTANVDELVQAAMWPHEEYLRTRVGLADDLVDLLATQGDASQAKRVAAAALSHIDRIAMIGYRASSAAESWTLTPVPSSADLRPLEQRLDAAFHANPRRLEGLATDIASWGRTLVVRLAVPGRGTDAVLMAILLDPLYANVFSPQHSANFVLQVYDDTGLVWGEPGDPARYERVVTRAFPVAGQRWTMRAWPRSLWLSDERRREWWAVAQVGLGTALLVAAATFWLMMRWSRLAAGTDVAEQRTRLILDNALDAVITIDERGIVTGWNAHAESMFGWSRKEVLGRLLADTIVPPRYRDAHTEGIARFLVEGVPKMLNRRVEITAWHRDGHEFPVELSITATRLDDGYSFTGFVRDITDRRLAEEELKRAKESAEASNRAKSEFLATMSHEIRTPMNGVFGMTELALDTSDDAERRDFLQRARACAESLMTIINDILDFSKIEAGKLDLEFVDFDVHGVLNGVLDTLALDAGRKRLELVGIVDERLPSRLRGDPGRLRQVILNLGSNALKFTEHGEVVVRIEPLENAPTPAPDDPATIALRCSVTDSGIGIPLDKQQAIFESFTQADSSTTRRYGGTGLGLAISQRLVGLMGGEIGVQSEPGRGSTFFFSARFQPAEPVRLPDTATSLKGLRVLVVDDNATNRMFLLKTLQAWGCRPALASGGAEACDILKHAAHGDEAIELVLLDMRMPDVDGIETARRIRADASTRDVAIIALTSISRSATDLQNELKFAAALPKPIKHGELLSTITTLCAVGGADGVAAEKTAPRRILVVDDNEANRIVAQNVLRRAGYEVHLAVDGRAAITAFEQVAPELVLMDVQMPDMDGVAATEAIRASEDASCRVPILALTAGMSADDRERCLSAGMNGYVIKPLRREQLLDAVTLALAPASTGDGAARHKRRVPAAVDGAAASGLDGTTESFLDAAIERCRTIRAAASSGEAAVVEAMSRDIKGGAAQHAIATLRELAAALEALGRSGSLASVPALTTVLESELASARRAIGDAVAGERATS